LVIEPDPLTYPFTAGCRGRLPERAGSGWRESAASLLEGSA
jgi:hypothetical protein